jgi:hypothetical protein
MFEIVHVQSMRTMHQFIVTNDLRICSLWNALHDLSRRR